MIQVRCENERSQHQNKDEALRMLQARLQELARSEASGARAAERKGQVGSGQRGDKVRTIAVQRDSVTDHVTGKTTTYQKYRRGHLEDLW
jgi:peptide chain release factor 1